MIQVVAGILRQENLLLICQRHHADRFPLKWEFPGGKLLAGESPEQALVRELREELAVEVVVGKLIAQTSHAYRAANGTAGSQASLTSSQFEIFFFVVRKFLGEPQNLAFEAIAWVEPEDLLKYDFLEADRALVEKIASGELIL